ncbi:uncharacterized protein SPPG_07034 [Spizellomyces punctatus DAOM BR117]|uniref:Uncharacterized protein n=1 Tax=Spizellomyces punctatus (strain DAOM BR117) TaxID=645134 RepID=A0A0L0H999_SPIPD|nr:uncharacterized protein SPPG_07034 [Spizellomyces punctatus DAOM BR117]KNC97561.1 hypothetical protein SPPG_07034 [Spizellomyces punctatus DAOM BR117]|eukprot:XP_016605601.1 hypothetical protein SPPG_07034 [Spizellomyces punctatus DAOM BR117]
MSTTDSAPPSTAADLLSSAENDGASWEDPPDFNGEEFDASWQGEEEFEGEDWGFYEEGLEEYDGKQETLYDSILDTREDEKVDDDSSKEASGTAAIDAKGPTEQQEGIPKVAATEPSSVPADSTAAVSATDRSRGVQDSSRGAWRGRGGGMRGRGTGFQRGQMYGGYRMYNGRPDMPMYMPQSPVGHKIYINPAKFMSLPPGFHPYAHPNMMRGRGMPYAQRMGMRGFGYGNVGNVRGRGRGGFMQQNLPRDRGPDAIAQPHTYRPAARPTPPMGSPAPDSPSPRKRAIEPSVSTPEAKKARAEGGNQPQSQSPAPNPNPKSTNNNMSGVPAPQGNAPPPTTTVNALPGTVAIVRQLGPGTARGDVEKFARPFKFLQFDDKALEARIGFATPELATIFRRKFNKIEVNGSRITISIE